MYLGHFQDANSQPATHKILHQHATNSAVHSYVYKFPTKDCYSDSDKSSLKSPTLVHYYFKNYFNKCYIMLSLTLPYKFSEENVFIIFSRVLPIVHVPFTSLSLVEVSPYFVTSTI